MLVVCFYKIKKFYRGCWNLYRNCKEVDGTIRFGVRGKGSVTCSTSNNCLLIWLSCPACLGLKFWHSLNTDPQPTLTRFQKGPARSSLCACQRQFTAGRHDDSLLQIIEWEKGQKKIDRKKLQIENVAVF